MSATITDDDVIRVSHDMIERGDVVWERVQLTDELVKFKPWKVMEVVRAAARVVPVDGNNARPRTIPFGQLRMRPPPNVARRRGDVPTPATASLGDVMPPTLKVLPTAPAPIVAAVTSQAAATRPPEPTGAEVELDAWIAMGRDLVAKLEAEQATYDQERARLYRAMEELESVHRETIARLERELAQARASHESECKVVQDRIAGLDQRIQAIVSRKATFQTIMRGAR